MYLIIDYLKFILLSRKSNCLLSLKKRLIASKYAAKLMLFERFAVNLHTVFCCSLKLVTQGNYRYLWPGGTARRLQILRDGFDSWLEPISFDIYRVAADSKSASSLRSLPLLLLSFLFNMIFKNFANGLRIWGVEPLTSRT